MSLFPQTSPGSSLDVGSNLFPISSYDRPRLAMMSLMSRNPSSAVRSLLSPHSLTPEELAQASKGLMGEGKKKNKVLSALGEVVTHPLFLIGAGMAFMYPLAKAPQLFSVAANLAKSHLPLSPLLRLIGTPRTIFAGTPKVADTIDDIVRETMFFRENYSHKFGQGLSQFISTMKRNPTPKERILLAAKLDGLDDVEGWFAKKFGKPLFKPLKMNPGLDRLYRHFRGVYREMSDDIWKGVKYNARGEMVIEPGSPMSKIRDALGRSGFDVSDAELKGILGSPQYKYYPHHVSKEFMQRRYFQAAGVPNTRPLTEAVEGRLNAAGVEKIWAPEVRARTGVMIPYGKHLSEVSEFLNPDMREKILKGASQAAQAADEWVDSGLNKFRKSLNTWKAHGMTPVKSEGEWYDFLSKSVFGGGLKDLGMTKDAADQVARHVSILLENGEWDTARNSLRAYAHRQMGFLPYSMDSLSTTQSYIFHTGTQHAFTVKGLGPKLRRFASLLEPSRRRILENDYIPMLRGQSTPGQFWMKEWWSSRRLATFDWLKESKTAQSLVPRPIRDWMSKRLEESMVLPQAGLGSAMAGYFYLGALGGNVSASGKNLLQTLLTTSTLRGVKNTLGGMSRLMPKIGKYAEARLSGLADEEAMWKVFPEFMKSGLQPSPIAEMALRNATKSEIVPVGMKGAAAVDKFKSGLMSLFTGSERFNRLTAFETGLGEMVGGGGKVTDEAIKYATKLVQVTQFPGGPTGLPFGLRNVPHVFRQFMHFPLRYMEYLHGSTLWGSGVTGKRMLGPLGRTLASSTAAYTLGKRLLGVNLAPGLASGALPLPQFPGSPFYPFPFVPPVASIVGGGIQALATGDTRPLSRVAGLAFPGGIGAMRAYRTLAPRYAQYDRKTPDGKIPVMNREGMLVGNYRPTELVGRAIGITPMSYEKEWELVQYLTKQRDQLREYRRSYLEALLGNDMSKANSIQEEFQRRYPSMGGIQVKRSDVTAMQNRLMNTRVTRVLRQFPKSAQGIFGEVVSQTLGPGYFEQGLYGF